MVGRQLLHSLPITLNGLLDYDDNDVEEELLELGLFAEGFQEMIMCDYGTSIYNFLLKDRPGALDREATVREEARKEEEKIKEERAQEARDREERKRAREAKEKEAKDKDKDKKDEPKSGDAKKVEEGSKAAKDDKDKGREEKGKAEEDKSKDEKAGSGGDKEEKGKSAAGSKRNSEVGEDQGPAKKTRKDDKEDSKEAIKAEQPTPGAVLMSPKEREDLTAAFRYFDKTGTGYLRCEDLRRIVHNLGLQLPHRRVRTLVLGVSELTGRFKGERVMYKELI